MAIVAPNTLSTSQIVLGNGETLTVGDGAAVVTTTTTVTASTAASNNELLILGTLFSDVDQAIHLKNSTLIELVTGTSALIYSAGFIGAELRAAAAIQVDNAGLIKSTASSGLFAMGTATDANVEIFISNSGEISGIFGGLRAFSGEQANRIINSGLITATQGDAVTLGTTTGSIDLVNSGEIISLGQFNDAVTLSGDASISNTGTIQATGTGIFSLNNLLLVNDGRILSGGTAVNAQSATVTNNGEILGDMTFSGLSSVTNSGDLVGSLGLNGGGSLMNTGMVEGSVTGGASADDLVLNFGLIGADLYLIGGADILRNGGTIGGSAYLGDGNDIYRGQGGQILGSVEGGNGGDTLTGGRFDDSFDGGADGDTLRGRGGDDTLIGGTGKDQLSGGAGEDAFFFASGDSAKGNNADVITDFRSGIDVIDLSGFAGPLDFVGAAAFSKSAGEVRFKTAALFTVVQIDTDGNGKADSEIRLTNAGPLDAADFIL